MKVRTIEVFKHLNSKYEIGIGEKTVNYNLKIHQYITPAIVESGWDLKTQIRQEVPFTKGKLIIKG